MPEVVWKKGSFRDDCRSGTKQKMRHLEGGGLLRSARRPATDEAGYSVGHASLVSSRLMARQPSAQASACASVVLPQPGSLLTAISMGRADTVWSPA